MPKDQEKTIFYINNYINQDQFNQLYNFNWLNKNIQNKNAVVCRLQPALTKAINLKLEKTQKKQKASKKQKVEIVAAKRHRDREKISLSS